MKSILYYVFVGCVMICFASCSTSTKFTVYGEPGTQILTPGRTTLATIDNTGKVKIANSDDSRDAFLLSHKPGSEDYIPFALDYKRKTRIGAYMASGLGWAIWGAGLGAAAGGLATCIAGDSDAGGPWVSAGLLSALAGIGILCPAMFRKDQLAYLYEYKYLDVQKTNQDLHFTQPQFESNEPVIPVEQEVKVETSSETNKTLLSSNTTKTLKDYATRIEGTYVGNGTLKQGDEIIETYSDISVTIKRKSKDVVLVNVIESDGSKFFTTDGEYNIKKQSDGKYTLTLKGINSATIEIDVTNNLVYIHPRVNIDGEIYKLNINAKK